MKLSEKGQGMVEYILIVALISIIALAAVKAFGGKVQALFNHANSKIASETSQLK